MIDPKPDPPLPPGVLWAAGFFAASGLLDAGLALAEIPSPATFWPVWQAIGSGLLYLILGLGLLRRFALCRTVAMVYCLAALVTYVAVLALALGQAPLTFPRSVVVQSLFQVPSCAVLLPYLRSAEAALTLRRPLL